MEVIMLFLSFWVIFIIFVGLYNLCELLSLLINGLILRYKRNNYKGDRYK